ncbi:uncharacterized protein LOC111007761 [Momordica charantia]|uniref:Uncharacterized protein LOC111007761 n=1 Tax=Momordica charantia TaxID=3673 RepID=A0A6J1C2V5_MOMCH|nr:uncharacterized protein LOC111007761 [Momordica charantia]
MPTVPEDASLVNPPPPSPPSPALSTGSQSSSIPSASVDSPLSPYYLHYTDNTGLVLVTHLLTEENYIVESIDVDCFVVHKLSQFVSRLGKEHLAAVYHLLRYLKKVPGGGIFLFASNSFQLKAFSDADWGSCVDNQKSTIGFCVSFVPPALLFCDNNAAIHIASNSSFHERTKHIDLDVILFEKSFLMAPFDCSLSGLLCN